MNRLITEHASLAVVPSGPAAVTFDELAAAWLHHVEHVDGIKPSTLKSYRYMLGAPGDRARKRGRRRAGARIMREFGGQAIDSITTTQVERWLEDLHAEDIPKRTVNTYRQLVCSVLEHAARRPEGTPLAPRDLRARDGDRGRLLVRGRRDRAEVAEAAHRAPRDASGRRACAARGPQTVRLAR